MTTLHPIQVPAVDSASVLRPSCAASTARRRRPRPCARPHCSPRRPRGIELVGVIHAGLVESVASVDARADGRARAALRKQAWAALDRRVARRPRRIDVTTTLRTGPAAALLEVEAGRLERRADRRRQPRAGAARRQAPRKRGDAARPRRRVLGPDRTSRAQPDVPALDHRRRRRFRAGAERARHRPRPEPPHRGSARPGARARQLASRALVERAEADDLCRRLARRTRPALAGKRERGASPTAPPGPC